MARWLGYASVSLTRPSFTSPGRSFSAQGLLFTLEASSLRDSLPTPILPRPPAYTPP